MANDKDVNKLQEAKAVLKKRGLKPSDYGHLSYDQLLKLAGIKGRG